MANDRQPKSRWLKRMVGLGLLAGLAYAVWRAVEDNADKKGGGWEPQPFPFPPQPRAPQPRVEDGIDATGGTCPDSHPVKGKRSSGIYHVPGGASYDRTKPDRCYVDARAAEADGLRPAKR